MTTTSPPPDFDLVNRISVVRVPLATGDVAFLDFNKAEPNTLTLARAASVAWVLEQRGSLPAEYGPSDARAAPAMVARTPSISRAVEKSSQVLTGTGHDVEDPDRARLPNYE